MLYCGQYGTAKMIWFFNRTTKYSFFAGYFPSHCVDPYVVATHSDGGQGAFGYWIYPLEDGSMHGISSTGLDGRHVIG